ncbi:glycosyltransferase family 2 protein [Bifidobacterium pseudolongum]|uniref:glycosyltransferase family 2 protein n=1 Tax=Bifidobacterium pseudolongum TaxID=1694 RepID=UPI00101F52BE|nr:glycosyltransferase family 2 protein [Bifidobacterium pseudolongum]RYQ06223.1 glycosyl transferase [Bifidobacterium pseudolongum subsp. globosum]
MSEKVTVIVPVYNNEKYLKQCVSSIIGQTYENIEILLIDDGSTDSSASICEELSESDGRIRVFHISNGGPGRARNIGLESAQGEYILFVDSDDYIERTAIEELMSVVNSDGTDLVCFNFEAFDNNQIYPRESFVANPFPSISLSSSRRTLDFIYEQRLENYSWAFLYRASSIQRYNMRYKQDYDFLEDMVMLNHYLRNPLTVSYLNKVLYHYRVNYNSITHNLNYKRVLDTTDTIEEVSRILLDEGKLSSYSVFCLYQIMQSDDRGILRAHPRLDEKRKNLSRTLYSNIDNQSIKLKITYMLYRMNLFYTLYNTYMYYKKALKDKMGRQKQ